MTTEQQLMAQRIPTRTPTDGDELLDFWRTLDYDYADATATLMIDATAASPLIITEVINVVWIAFNGGSASIDVGDGSTADYWIDTADVTEASAGFLTSSHWSDTAGGGSAYSATSHGRRYTTAASVVMTLGGSVGTTGTGTVFVHCLRYTPS